MQDEYIWGGFMERAMKEWTIYNQKKIELARKKIQKYIESGKDFKIFLFDIDDTFNKSREATEEQIEKINFKASEKYRRLYEESHPFFGDQMETADFNKTFWDLRNQILEDFDIYYQAIDYNLIHQSANLYCNAMEFLNYFASNHDNNTFVFLLSHYNPERESVLKIQKYYEYTMNADGESCLDGILTLPVFIERYEPNGKSRKITSKTTPLYSQLGLSPKHLSKCYLIDDSGRVRRDFKERGGIVIPAYLERGYLECFEDDKNDRQRVITDWDICFFQTVLNKIQYEKKMGIRETKNYKIKTK